MMVSRLPCSLSSLALFSFFALVPGEFSFADDLFEKPVRLKADGKVIDTGEAWGHSSPCIEDIDYDGLDDLILGDFGGKFQIYKNVGQKNAPAYKDIGKIQADGKDASVNIYCCVGGQPRFVDLNGDGIRDFISSSYDPGHCYYFQGLGNSKFAASKELKDKAGIPVRTWVELKKDYQSFGSFFAPVDWDSDGDFDILIGSFDGHLKLRINEGDAKNPVFASENITVNAGNQPLKVKAHCCPLVADWDNDGRWDILSGSDDGSVTWFRNTGSESTPLFAQGEILVPKHDGSGYHYLRWSDKDIIPGIRSQIEVTDFNDDGKLDLIVGDFCTAFDMRSDLTKSEKEQATKLVNKLNSAGKNFSDQIEALRERFKKKYPGDELFSDEADAEWTKEYNKIKEGPAFKEIEDQESQFLKNMKPYFHSRSRDSERVFQTSKAHGYVWLYLRK